MTLKEIFYMTYMYKKKHFVRNTCFYTSSDTLRAQGWHDQQHQSQFPVWSLQIRSNSIHEVTVTRKVRLSHLKNPWDINVVAVTWRKCSFETLLRNQYTKRPRWKKQSNYFSSHYSGTAKLICWYFGKLIKPIAKVNWIFNV